LADEGVFHGALARKWLGVDAGENNGATKGGEAVAFLAWAKKELEELKDGGRGFGIGREKEKKERRKDKVVEELDSVTVFWKHYKKLNDSVSPDVPVSYITTDVFDRCRAVELSTSATTIRFTDTHTSRTISGRYQTVCATRACVWPWVH
jgi:hypothetical protein